MAKDWRAEDLWIATLGVLQMEVTRPTYQTWLEGTRGAWGPGNELIVSTPSSFVASYLEQRLYSLVKRTLEQVAGGPLDVEFKVQVDSHEPHVLHSSISQSPDDEINLAPQHPPRARNLFNARYTFSTFIVGASNQLAHAAAQSVSDSPGDRYNPLFLYSDVGLGKTHLLHAIGQTLQSRGQSVLYVSAEQFTNDFVKAIREGKSEAFHLKYRGGDVLLIDDVQFISGKEQTQEAFFHTFNELHNSNRQIVLTSDRPPSALALLEERLRSRFEWGLIADIQHPDLETKLAILEQKAISQARQVPPEVIHFLVGRRLTSVRDLEGSLNRVIAWADLLDKPITVDLASQTLANLSQREDILGSTPEDIISAVADHFSLTAHEITSHSKNKKTVAARQIAMYLLQEIRGPNGHPRSISEIGKLFGGMADRTVSTGSAKTRTLEKLSSATRLDITAIKSSLQNPARSQQPVLSTA